MLVPEFVDPSGGASDAMALAIAHRSAHGHLDAARETRPPFNPDAATTVFSSAKAYGIGTVIGDRYAGEWVRERFRRDGIDYQVSEAASRTYDRDALPLSTPAGCQLLDVKRLINQRDQPGAATARAAAT